MQTNFEAGDFEAIINVYHMCPQSIELGKKT